MSDYAIVDETGNTKARLLTSDNADEYAAVKKAEKNNKRPKKEQSGSTSEAVTQETSQNKIPITTISSSQKLSITSNPDKSVPEEDRNANGRSKPSTLPREIEAAEPELNKETGKVSDDSTEPNILARGDTNTQNKQLTIGEGSKEVKTLNAKDTKGGGDIVPSTFEDDSAARRENAIAAVDSMTKTPEDPDHVYGNVTLDAPVSKPIAVADLPGYVKEQNKTGGFKPEMQVCSLLVFFKKTRGTTHTYARAHTHLHTQ